MKVILETYDCLINIRGTNNTRALYGIDPTRQQLSQAARSELMGRYMERYLGEFAIGTNYGIDRFTKSILYDEKIDGTIHMALYRGYPQTGSKNVSAIHWDMICDMRDGGKIWVDGQLFYDSGEFVFLN